MSDASPYFHQQKLTQAEELWQAEKYDQAIQVLHEILAEDVYHIEASFLLGLFYYRLHQYEKAKPLYIPFLSQAETAARAKFNLGKVAFAEENPSEAFRFFRECLFEYPNHALTLAWYARCSPTWDESARQAAKQAETLANQDLQVLSIIFFAYHEQTAAHQLRDEKQIFDIMQPHLNDNGNVYFQLLMAQKTTDAPKIVRLIADYERKHPEDQTYHNTYLFYQNKINQQTHNARSKTKPALFWMFALIILFYVFALTFRKPNKSTKPPPPLASFPSFSLPPEIETWRKLTEEGIKIPPKRQR